MIACPDVRDVYLVPSVLEEQGLDTLVLDKLGLGAPRGADEEWSSLVERIDTLEGEVEIALVGKYVKLHDAYLSVHEALKHSGVHHGCRVRVRWFDAENMTLEEAARELEGVDGVLVPGGFGSRGWEGKVLACRVARERGIPYLGICLGMHVAVSEFARHVVGLEGANSTEMDPETPYPVIDLLPEQKEVEDLGGTMRLGAQAVELGAGDGPRGDVRRRGRPRAPPAPLRGEQRVPAALVDAGLVVSGTFQEGGSSRSSSCGSPWFVASQFHRSSSRGRRVPRRSSASSSALRSRVRASAARSRSPRRADQEGSRGKPKLTQQVSAAMFVLPAAYLNGNVEPSLRRS